LGLVIVAATARGICSVRFGENEGALIEELRANFPNANIEKAGPEFDAWASAVVDYIDRPGTAPDLPLDIRGTAFQQRVWLALREIPIGSTKSYAQLAARAGNPSAVRAVGTACGANPVAVLIPCHRAVRSDGALSGYRWGLERKQALLKNEVSASVSPPAAPDPPASNSPPARH
jgi:AraC family transcriptional regulator of adaptative response/methylated-DNA-[protein]-cysteine methyltransferase